MDNTNFVIASKDATFSNYATSYNDEVPCFMSSSPNYNYRAMVDEILEVIDSNGFTTDNPINPDSLTQDIIDIIWSYVEGDKRHE